MCEKIGVLHRKRGYIFQKSLLFKKDPVEKVLPILKVFEDRQNYLVNVEGYDKPEMVEVVIEAVIVR